MHPLVTMTSLITMNIIRYTHHRYYTLETIVIKPLLGISMVSTLGHFRVTQQQEDFLPQIFFLTVENFIVKTCYLQIQNKI